MEIKKQPSNSKFENPFSPNDLHPIFIVFPTFSHISSNGGGILSSPNSLPRLSLHSFYPGIPCSVLFFSLSENLRPSSSLGREGVLKF
jgi:hypothetical protein